MARIANAHKVPVVPSTVGVVNGAERTIPELKEVSQRIVHNVPHALTCRALGLSQSWVRRQFTAPAPNVLWCRDLTVVDTDVGKL